MNRIILILAFMMVFVTSVLAQDFSKAFDAYSVGDYTTAIKEWTLLAEQGDAHAQSNLGNMYRDGEGVDQNYKKAVDWYRSAAEQGHAYAQARLGFMYWQGNGVLKDGVIAHMWFNIANANGDEFSGGSREDVAETMSQQAIESANALARECLSSGYEKCGY
ncbi:tetratricopeptide repeat protein [Pseudopelagicola sp. nBUS_19]|uniref:tetratricopeptide repeat protein n=1 Tax=unclassified Pseudopelagicola TaxID=2649563 RepID=UPI003EC0A500